MCYLYFYFPTVIALSNALWCFRTITCETDAINTLILYTVFHGTYKWSVCFVKSFGSTKYCRYILNYRYNLGSTSTQRKHLCDIDVFSEAGCCNALYVFAKPIIYILWKYLYLLTIAGFEPAAPLTSQPRTLQRHRGHRIVCIKDIILSETKLH